MQNVNKSLNESLQAKYPHLEIAILPLSQVQKDNESKRIDSEYFKKEYLENEIKLENIGYLTLSQMSYQITDFGAYSQTNMIDFFDSGILFLRNQDIKESFVDCGDNVYIDKSVFEKLTLKLQEFDIVIPRVGTLGNAAIIEAKHLPCSANQNLAVVRLNKEYNPYFVTLFLSSYFGKNQIFRTSTGNVQQWLNLATISAIKIPQFSQDFQLEIQNLVQDSHKALEDSKALYKEAERLLYESLGLDSHNPLASLQESRSISSLRGFEKAQAIQNKNIDCHDLPRKSRNDGVVDCHADKSARNDDIARKYPHLNLSIRSLSKSYGISGRLDSEYYQTKYDAIERKIRGYQGGWDYIKAFFSHNNATCDFSKDRYNYIEIGDISTSNGTASYNEMQTNELPANAKIVIAKDDILISKVRPYRGAVAIIDFDVKDTIASGAFVVLRKNSSFRQEVLQVLLRTAIYKEWLLKWNVGTSYPVIKDEDILNLPIPKIDSTTQEQIALKIQNLSLCAKNQKIY